MFQLVKLRKEKNAISVKVSGTDLYGYVLRFQHILIGMDPL